MGFKKKDRLPDDVGELVKLLEELEFKEYQTRLEIEREERDNALYYVPLKPNPKQEVMLKGWLEQKYKVFTFTGGNRCLGGETEIWDPVEFRNRRVDGIKGDFHVLAYDMEKMVIARAEKPFMKEEIEPIYRVELSNGEWFTASGSHRVLTLSGWKYISSVQEGFSFYLPLSNSDTYRTTHPLNVQSCGSRERGSRCGCQVCFCYDDEQPRHAQAACQGEPPSRSDGIGHISSEACGHMGATGSIRSDTRYDPHESRPSNQDDHLRFSALHAEHLSRASYIYGKHAGSHILSADQSTCGFYPPLPTFLSDQQASRASCNGYNHGLRVASDVVSYPICTSIKKIRDDVKYDFTVPYFGNYYAGGAIHHNSAKTSTTCWILLSVLFGEYIWDGTKLRFPHKSPRKIRWVGQDWEKHIKTVLIPCLWQWWPRKRGMPEVKKNNVGVEAFWTDPISKSTLEIMSNKQESDLFEGWFGDVVAYDEPPKRDVRVACSRGLIDRNGREIFAMTLLKEAWVDREVINARNPDGTPDQTVFNVHAEIYDNVGFGITMEGVDQFSKSLKDYEKDARLKGIPSYKHGIILHNFRRERNLRPRLKTIPLDWIIDVAIDFHPSKPWDVLFRAIDSRNFHYLIDEIEKHGSWKDIGEEIVRKLKNWACRVNQIAIDPLAKGDAQSDLSGESVYDKLQELFAAYGYFLVVASKDKENGILAVNDLLFTQNEMPALFVFDDLKVTTQQMEDWMYDEDGKPSKVDDDMCENLYRLALLGTQYEPPRDYEPTETRRYEHGRNGRNAVTGY